jgi:hypothetical protein
VCASISDLITKLIYLDQRYSLVGTLRRTLMMEAVNTSETSVNFYETIRRNIPQDCHLHTNHRKNTGTYFERRLFFHNSLHSFL